MIDRVSGASLGAWMLVALGTRGAFGDAVFLGDGASFWRRGLYDRMGQVFRYPCTSFTH